MPIPSEQHIQVDLKGSEQTCQTRSVNTAVCLFGYTSFYRPFVYTFKVAICTEKKLIVKNVLQLFANNLPLHAVLRHHTLKRADGRNSLTLDSLGRVKELNVRMVWSPSGMETFKQDFTSDELKTSSK